MEPTFCQMDPVIRAISGRMRAGSGFFGETQPASHLVDLRHAEVLNAHAG